MSARSRRSWLCTVSCWRPLTHTWLALKSVEQVKAEDDDGGRFGRVQYALIDDGDDARSNSVEGADTDFFALDADTGVLKTKRLLEDVPSQRLPFRLTVEARDNPGGDAGSSNAARAQAVVNIVMPSNLLVLVLQDVRPERVQVRADSAWSCCRGARKLGVVVITSSDMRCRARRSA